MATVGNTSAATFIVMWLLKTESITTHGYELFMVQYIISPFAGT